jgi:O-methyltransferase
MNNIPANKETCEISLDVLKRMQPWRVKNSPYAYNHIVPAATLSPWYSDIEFIEIYSKIGTNYTLVDHYRCYELWTLAKQTHKIPGVILEVGVWKGGTGTVLAKAAPAKKVYLADTFSGVVKASSKDLTYIGGEHSDTSRATVQTILDELDITNAEVLVGVFPDDTGHMI